MEINMNDFVFNSPSDNNSKPNSIRQNSTHGNTSYHQKYFSFNFFRSSDYQPDTSEL
jgi:hypothetical protein